MSFITKNLNAPQWCCDTWLWNLNLPFLHVISLAVAY